jgi:hypothetical protein
VRESPDTAHSELWLGLQKNRRPWAAKSGFEMEFDQRATKRFARLRDCWFVTSGFSISSRSRLTARDRKHHHCSSIAPLALAPPPTPAVSKPERSAYGCRSRPARHSKDGGRGAGRAGNTRVESPVTVQEGSQGKDKAPPLHCTADRDRSYSSFHCAGIKQSASIRYEPRQIQPSV